MSHEGVSTNAHFAVDQDIYVGLARHGRAEYAGKKERESNSEVRYWKIRLIR